MNALRKIGILSLLTLTVVSTAATAYAANEDCDCCDNLKCDQKMEYCKNDDMEKLNTETPDFRLEGDRFSRFDS